MHKRVLNLRNSCLPYVAFRYIFSMYMKWSYVVLLHDTGSTLTEPNSDTLYDQKKESNSNNLTDPIDDRFMEVRLLLVYLRLLRGNALSNISDALHLCKVIK